MVGERCHYLSSPTRYCCVYIALPSPSVVFIGGAMPMPSYPPSTASGYPSQSTNSAPLTGSAYPITQRYGQGQQPPHQGYQPYPSTQSYAPQTGRWNTMTDYRTILSSLLLQFFHVPIPFDVREVHNGRGVQGSTPENYIKKTRLQMVQSELFWSFICE